MADYRNLEVWGASKRLAVRAYRLCERLPAHEQFNLASQIQRAAVSVVANVAEGAGRGTDLDFARFVRIALRSLSELSALIDLAEELHSLTIDGVRDEIRDLQVRLTNLVQRLERDGGRIREEVASYAASEQP